MALPLSVWHARSCFLQSLLAAAVFEAAPGARSPMQTVLGDPRLASFGCRPGMRLSLGSVYAMQITKFLRGDWPLHLTRVFATGISFLQEAKSISVTRNGEMLLAVVGHCILVLRVVDGALVRIIGKLNAGNGELEFSDPVCICTAPDDVHFVAETRNNRVQSLTSEFGFGGIPFRPPKDGIVFAVEATAQELTVGVTPRDTGSLDFDRIQFHSICRATGSELRRVSAMDFYGAIVPLRDKLLLWNARSTANGEFVASSLTGAIFLFEAGKDSSSHSIEAAGVRAVTVHGTTVYATSSWRPGVYVFG